MCLTKIYKTQKGADEAHLHPCIAKKEIKVYKILKK